MSSSVRVSSQVWVCTNCSVLVWTRMTRKRHMLTHGNVSVRSAYNGAVFTSCNVPSPPPSMHSPYNGPSFYSLPTMHPPTIHSPYNAHFHALRGIYFPYWTLPPLTPSMMHPPPMHCPYNIPSSPMHSPGGTTSRCARYACGSGRREMRSGAAQAQGRQGTSIAFTIRKRQGRSWVCGSAGSRRIPPRA